MFSLIIPTRNRSEYLDALLRSVTANTDPAGTYEVIVVDNGSTDNTKAVTAHYSAQIKNLIYLYNDIPGLLTGRHAGAAAANGEVLCFLDDDVKLNPNYLRAVIQTFANKKIELATGPCLPDYEISAPDWVDYFWSQGSDGRFCSWLSLLDLGNKKRTIDPNFVWGLNFCIRKATLIKLNGFHPDCVPDNLQQYQGDGETGLAMKAKKLGISAAYIPNLALHHLVSKERLTIAYFKKRAFYQGVCDSYSTLRAQFLPEKTTVHKENFKQLITRQLNRVWNKLKKKEKAIPDPAGITDIRTTLNESYLEGYAFHQSAFNTVEKVKQWVLKENYWDYKLPE